MPVLSHYTAPDDTGQIHPLVGDAWATEVVPRLPASLNEQARTLKAFVRVRGIASPSDLLRAILAFVLEGFSSRAWGAWAVLLGLADISDRAWSKRLRSANPFLAWLVGEVVAAELPSDAWPHGKWALPHLPC